MKRIASARRACFSAAPRRGDDGPGAFTLMEILLALGLGMVLLASAWKGVELHWRYTTAGQLDMERCQLARTLLQKMALDIRSVVYRSEALTVQSAAGGTTGGETDEEGTSGESSSSTSESESETGSEEDRYFDQAVGVIGDGLSLTLHVSKPSRGSLLTTLADGSQLEATASDQQTVEYFLAGTLGAESGQPVEVFSTDGTIASQGLVRTQGDRFEIALADMVGSDSSALRDTRVLAPEVNLLQFRYFDGVEWVEEWDSVTYGALPTAIEITLGFEPPDANVAPMLAQTASVLTETYRLVVALPLAEPYTGSEGL